MFTIQKEWEMGQNDLTLLKHKTTLNFFKMFLSLPSYNVAFILSCIFQGCYVFTYLYLMIRPCRNHGSVKENKKSDEWKLHFAKTLYFIAISLTELAVFQSGDGFDGYPWLPSWLGGKGEGEWRNLDYRASLPQSQLNLYIQVVYLQTFYHFFSGITSILPGNRTKPEMILHHVITMFLMVCAVQADRAPEGTMFLFLHDVPDIFTSFTKGLYALDLVYPTFISYCFIMCTWCYCRMYLVGTFSYSIYTNPGNTLMKYCGICCCMLFCLHCFWFYLFFRMGAKFISSKGKVLPRDTSQNDFVDGSGSGSVSVSDNQKAKRNKMEMDDINICDSDITSIKAMNAKLKNDVDIDIDIDSDSDSDSDSNNDNNDDDDNDTPKGTATKRKQTLRTKK
jgi:hypothetical protein